MKQNIVFLVFLMILLSACSSNLSTQSDPPPFDHTDSSTPSDVGLSTSPTEDLSPPTPSDGGLSTPPTEDVSSQTPSEDTTTPCSNDYSPPPPSSRPDAETNTSVSPQPNGLAPKIFTKHEIYDVKIFHADWNKVQMEKIGLTKEVYKQAAVTCYYNDNKSIVYKYDDYFESDEYNTSTPFSITVFGDDIIGPRGIRVGDTFEEVMALFPQEQDWEEDKDGVFYGTYNSDYDPDVEQKPAGRVETYHGWKQIDIITGGYGPLMRMDFPGGILTQYTIYMYLAT